MLQITKSTALTLAILLPLAGCERTTNDAAPAASPPVAAASEIPAQMSGKEAYDMVCAGCHEEGINGAPKTGDREAWAGRSWLWEAVLFEHAKEGFNEMPAKGGVESLDDATVEKAAEYMLSKTFPGVNQAD